MLNKSPIFSRRARTKVTSDINITPFTDVILVLLIIFMVTTPLLSQSTLKINLPEAQSAEASRGAQQTRAFIAINNEGVLYLNDKIVTRKELKEQLREIQLANPAVGVTLRADRAARFKDVVEVLDALNELAVAKLDIETLQARN